MKMLNTLTWLALSLSLLAAWATLAQQSPTPEAAPTETNDRPEYRVRSLPTDTFKPSEKVQEDFPVPFPEDI